MGNRGRVLHPGNLIVLSSSSFACAWPRQSLWQLPPPAARFLCAAVIYTHSKSSASLHPARRYHDGLSCSLAHGSGEYIGKAIGRGGAGAAEGKGGWTREGQPRPRKRSLC